MHCHFRPRPHYAGKIWNRSFTSTIRPTVHTNSVTKAELFKKTLQTGGIWKGRLCVWVWTENILKTEIFENDDDAIILWFPSSSFPWTQIQNARRSVHGKRFMRFQSQNTVFKFLRRVRAEPQAPFIFIKCLRLVFRDNSFSYCFKLTFVICRIKTISSYSLGRESL